jgi:hypothetical protein
MTETIAPGARAEDISERRAGDATPTAYATALVAAVLTFVALAVFFLIRYPLKDYLYPVGWDPAWYVWRTNSVTFDGLARIGAIRAASPLFLAVFMRATGQNAFTMVTVATPIFASMVALGAAAMVRGALGVRPMWVPVLGAITWIAFGRIGIVGGHLDNALNAAFVLSAFGAAVACIAGGRGAVATWILFAAAALAEWPFYALSMAMFLLALAWFAWPAARDRLSGRPASFGAAGPLLGAAAASLGFAGLTFLAAPPGGGIGVKRYTTAFRDLIERRFYERLRQTSRYWAFPVAAVGAVAAGRAAVPPARRPARRFFLCLMGAWVAVTIVAGLAQVVHVPVAGARLVNFLFAVPVLAGVAVWWAARWLARRPWRRPLGVLAAVLVVGVALLGFGKMAWDGEKGRRPFITSNAVREAATAAVYLHRYAPDQPVAFIQSGSLPWNVTRSALPPDLVARATRFKGSPTEFESADPVADLGSPDGRRPIGVVIQAVNKTGYAEALVSRPEDVVAPGIIALGGPHLTRPLSLGHPARASTGVRTLPWITLLVVAYLFVAGGGWAVALLPADPVIRMALAPGLGAGTVAVAALGWDRVGLGFGGQAAWGPLILATVLGWAWALVTTRRRRLPAR